MTAAVPPDRTATDALGERSRRRPCFYDPDKVMSSHPASPSEHPAASVTLFWIPLGAGGVGYVRVNGRIYERVTAFRQQRSPLELYHTALEVRTTDGRFTVENAWPSPDADTESRGVVTEGPVFSRRLGRIRPFRYEIRRWQDGVIPDAAQAAVTTVLTTEPARAAYLLDQVPAVPALIWGRHPPGASEMWNSNSVISFLLARSGLLTEEIRPPSGGRAPGWDAGIVTARSSPGR